MLEALVMPFMALVASALLLTAATVAGKWREQHGMNLERIWEMSGGDEGAMTDAEFAAVVQDEGGVLEALERGVNADDLPDGELKDAWNRMDVAFDELQSAINELEDLLADAEAEAE